MPLSEHEQRQLEQIEQALYREDRRLARLVRSSDPRVHYRRRAVQAASGFAAGAGMVAAGLLLPHFIYLSIAGFAVMLLCGIWALVTWRQAAAAAAAARGGAAGRRRRRPGGPGRRASMMERLDERWRRRQEGDR